MYADLLDYETLARVKKTAPTVTNVPFDVACLVVRAMRLYSKETNGNIDQNGQIYWQARVKDLHEYGKFGGTVTLISVGRALKAMGLDSWRKMDGFHVAWSSAQLDILQEHFKA